MPRAAPAALPFLAPRCALADGRHCRHAQCRPVRRCWRPSPPAHVRALPTCPLITFSILFFMTAMSLDELPPHALHSNTIESQSIQDSSSIDLASQTKSRGKSDPAWEDCVQVSDGGKKKIRCYFCSVLIAGGGIHCFKQHLAGITRQIKSCKKVPAEVRYTMKRRVDEFDERKRKQEEAFGDENPYSPDVEQIEEESEDVCIPPPAARVRTSNTKGKKPATSSKHTPEIGKFFMPRTNPGDQPTIRSVLQNEKAKNRVDLILNKWFLDASVPFHATTSKYYQPMFDAVASYVPSYKGPSSYLHRGPLLV